MKRCGNELQPSGYEEDFLLLSSTLLSLYRQIQSRLEGVPAVRSGTREELLRRAEIGSEFIHSQASGPLRASCLSRYHFHRVFTQVFEMTLHRSLTRIRLARVHSALSSRNTCCRRLRRRRFQQSLLLSFLQFRWLRVTIHLAGRAAESSWDRPCCQEI